MSSFTFEAKLATGCFIVIVGMFFLPLKKIVKIELKDGTTKTATATILAGEVKKGYSYPVYKTLCDTYVVGSGCELGHTEQATIVSIEN